MMRGVCFLLVALAAAIAQASPGAPVLALRAEGKHLDLGRAALLTDVTGGRVRFPYGDGTFGTIAVGERAIVPGAAPDSRLHPAPQAVPGRTLSGDGRLAIAGLPDGTVRWYAAEDGRELLAWFPHPDRKRWVAFTPSGYYDASVGGEDLLCWQVERGPGLPPDLFRAALFRDRFYRPDLLSRVLFTQDEQRALKELNAEAGRTEQDLPLLRLLPPVVTILYPPPGALVTQRRISVRVSLRSPSGEPVTGLRALVRGRTTSARGISVQAASIQAALPGPGAEVRQLEVELPAEDATVVVLAETALAQSEPALRDLRWAGRRQADTAPRPDLYVLAIGVSEYRHQRLRLDYPAKDARDLAAAFREQQGKRYRRVEARVLVDAQATRAAILAGLDWLRRSTTPADTAAVFLAGHGVNDSATGKYHYLPCKRSRGSSDERAPTLVEQERWGSTESLITGSLYFCALPVGGDPRERLPCPTRPSWGCPAPTSAARSCRRRWAGWRARCCSSWTPATPATCAGPARWT